MADKNTVVINAFGGAGVGKTTSCFEICERLKKRGYVVDYAPEYAKELVWAGRLDMLSGEAEKQRVLLGEQNRRIARLVGQVDFVVTDSPLILNLMYNKELTADYTHDVLALFNSYNNFNYIVERDDSAYEVEGRIHTLEESKVIDKRITDFLSSNEIYYGTYSHKTIDKIADNCVVTLNRTNAIKAERGADSKLSSRGKGASAERKRLFVDMDGTLAVFTPVDEMETLYERGYFLNLAPIPSVVDAINYIAENERDVDVYVLSSYLPDSAYALGEKMAWLDRYLPSVGADKRIFIPCGKSKARSINNLKESDYLLDDYTVNLNDWEPPARGIKLLNGINHTHGTWQKDRLSIDNAATALADKITGIVCRGEMYVDEKTKNVLDRKIEVAAASHKDKQTKRYSDYSQEQDR